MCSVAGGSDTSYFAVPYKLDAAPLECIGLVLSREQRSQSLLDTSAESAMPMAGRKRAAAVDLSSRPRKLCRLGSGPSDVGRAIAMELQAEGWGNVDNAPDQPLVFLNATAEAVSSFDWSDLIGALDVSEAVAAQLLADRDLLVNVPGAARRVPISRRVILKEIVTQLGLLTYFAVRGWIEMEIPSWRVSGVKDRKRFYSDEEFERYGAMEGACDAAISHLQKACFVLVDDVNYKDVRALQKRALAAETWSSLLTDVLDGGRNNQKAIREAYASFFSEAKRLCINFGDVFPGGSIGSVGSSAAPNDGKVFYGGPRPPVSRAEQFAFELVDLINRSGDVLLVSDDVV